jgi:cellulose synthase/poly-beta-1,6-N-acetylglucosamine synthase-like glycosyltransferase
MLAAIELLFWSALGAIFFAFCGYPLLLALVAPLAGQRRKEGAAGPAAWPTATLLISAYNEEAVLAARLENGLALDYPEDKLAILVISDASTDSTDELARASAAGNGRVGLLRQPERRGKSAALNAAVAAATGEIVIFSDANSLYDRHALRELIRPFADPRVGLVTGRTRYLAAGGDGSRESISLYSRLELWTKRNESRIGSCVGADGAIFACRRELYRPLAADDINDLVLPLQVAAQGWRVVLAEGAFCLEEGSRSDGEYQRQVRIATRTLRALMRHKGLFSPVRRPWFAFQVVSHKLLKLMLPFFMLLALLANLILAGAGLSFYPALLILQGGGYALAAWGRLTGGRGKGSGAAYNLCLVSVAFLVGWSKWLRGETFTTWSPERARG